MTFSVLLISVKGATELRAAARLRFGSVILISCARRPLPAPSFAVFSFARSSAIFSSRRTAYEFLIILNMLVERSHSLLFKRFFFSL